MKDGKLPDIFANLHGKIERSLSEARSSFDHSGTKGTASEKVWLRLLQEYLPQRYVVESAHITDSNNNISDQIDVVIFDRQYSPFLFKFEDEYVVPAESVYAVFEAKQSINSTEVAYAKNKIKSVRTLHRTSLPIPYAKGTYPAKQPGHIYGGLLTLGSDWSPALGKSLTENLATSDESERLDVGCVAEHGNFILDQDLSTYDIDRSSRAATAFLFELIAMLQFSGTVPMIDIQAYAQWMEK